MVSIAQSVSTAVIDEFTASARVGVCYFDRLSGTLIELNSMDGHFLTVDPYLSAIRKYYITVAPGDPLSRVIVELTREDDLEREYSLKCIAAQNEPTAEDFSLITDFNSTEVLNPEVGGYIPLWIMIQSRLPMNRVSSLAIDLYYE